MLSMGSLKDRPANSNGNLQYQISRALLGSRFKNGPTFHLISLLLGWWGTEPFSAAEPLHRRYLSRR